MNIIKLDDYVIYVDTDSCKLEKGFDINVILDYNKKVKERIEHVSKKLGIAFSKYCPKDIKGVSHLLGVFEKENTENGEYSYDEFITQGAKKYAFKDFEGIHITVSGVPKKGACAINNLEEFKDNLVFKYKDTGKNSKQYNDNQIATPMIDYQGNMFYVADKTGVCLLPDSYTLGKSLEYASLISDNTSNRAIYKEEKDG